MKGRLIAIQRADIDGSDYHGKVRVELRDDASRRLSITVTHPDQGTRVLNLSHSEYEALRSGLQVTLDAIRQSNNEFPEEDVYLTE